jgi:hypothetical protein
MKTVHRIYRWNDRPVMDRMNAAHEQAQVHDPVNDKEVEFIPQR